MEPKPVYNFSRTRGPRKLSKDQQSNQFPFTMEYYEAERIRELVEDGERSGFFRLGTLVLAAILYDDDMIYVSTKEALDTSLPQAISEIVKRHLDALITELAGES